MFYMLVNHDTHMRTRYTRKRVLYMCKHAHSHKRRALRTHTYIHMYIYTNVSIFNLNNL